MILQQGTLTHVLSALSKVPLIPQSVLCELRLHDTAVGCAAGGGEVFKEYFNSIR